MWISRDSSGEGNGYALYAYLSNNPIDEVDSLGLMAYKEGFDDPSLSRGRLDDNDHSSIPGTPGMWAKKQFLMKSLSLAVYLYPDAAKHLWHYFSNSGLDYEIRLQGLIDDVPSAKDLYNRELASAQAFVEGLSPGKHEITSQAVRDGQVTDSESKNWFLAVGDYQAWGKGIATVCKGSKASPEFVLEFEYKFYDPYDWHENLGVAFTLPGGYELSDERMRKFHLMGYAKEFLMIGSVKKTVKWNTGEAPKIRNGWESEYKGR